MRLSAGRRIFPLCDFDLCEVACPRCCYNRVMTDFAKSPNVICNSVETIHSFPKVLLPSQFGAPCLDALTGIAATTQALAGQFLASRFDIAETLRSRFAAAQFHLAETLRGQFVLPRFEALIDIKSITHGIAETLQSYEREMSLYSDVAVLMEQADRVTAAGWIPHPALPIKELVGPETDTGKIAQKAYPSASGDAIRSGAAA